MGRHQALTEIEELLLMAAAVQGLGPSTDLRVANTARVVEHVLRWRGLSDEEIRRGWRVTGCDPTHVEVYDSLIRMVRVRWQRAVQKPQRSGRALFEGAGNWGVPGDPNDLACWPHFNSCRLTKHGERVARVLLEADKHGVSQPFMNEPWRRLKVGDRIRIVRMPSDAVNPGHAFMPETRRLFKKLIARRRPARVFWIDEYDHPWIQCRFRRRNGTFELHWLAINDDSWVRVKSGRKLPGNVGRRSPKTK